MPNSKVPRATEDVSDRFEYIRYAIDTSDVTPRACLTFSGPLDPSADYTSYVVVEPATPIVLAVNGQTLCVGGLTFGESRDVVLRAGLPSADGRELAADERTPIEFADRPAVVTFRGSGVILPRRDADGLAIETVNVDVVTVTVKRVNDRALAFKRISEGNAVAEGDWGWLDYQENPEDVAVTIWEGEMDIDGAANAPTTTVFPLAAALGQLEAGAYFVEVRQKREGSNFRGQPASARRWILFTDLALTTYRGQDGIDVVLRSLQTARPLANAEVTLVARNNEILQSTRTDRSGRVHFDAGITRGQGPLQPKLVMAYSLEGDFAALDLTSAPIDLTGQNISGRAPPDGADVFVYLDRGIYRPGETVRVSALVRDAEAVAMVGRPGALTIYRPNGIEAETIRFDSAERAGAIFHDYALSRDAARGRWRVALELDGLGVVGGESFSVEDFVPQRVALELDVDTETPIGAGEVRAIAVDVRFLYGAPGAGLPLEGEARIEVDPSPFDGFDGYHFGRHNEEFREQRLDLAHTVADGRGHAQVALDPQGAGEDSTKPLRVRVVVAVEEPGGRAVRESLIAPYRPRDVYLGLKPRFEGRARRGEDAVFDFVAVDQSGAATDARVEWKLLRNDWHYDWWRDNNGQWRWRRTREVVEIETGVAETTADGPVEIRGAGLDWGDYELVLTDPESGLEASIGFWVGWGGRVQEGVEAPDRVRVSAPEEPVVVGRTAEFAILAPYAGQAEIVIASDRVLASRSISVPEGGASVSFPVTEEWGAGVYVMVSVFTPRDPVETPRPRRAVGVAYAPVDMGARTFEIALDAPDVVRPRQTIDLRVTATGATPGAQTFVTIAAVDEGILRLTKFESPNPVDWYYGKKRLGVDLRDDYGRLLDPNQGAAASLRVGGDQLGGEGLTVTPTRTVALFSGPVALARDGTTVIPIELPDFNGELRLMAVAWSANAVGSAERPLTVRDEVPAELILPRFLAPGDESVATATLDNVEGAPGVYVALAETGDPLAIGDGRVEARLARGERRDTTIPIAAEEEGIGSIELSVTGPDGFSVARAYPIQVRSAYLPARYVQRALMSPGESYQTSTDLLSSFVAGSGEVTVSFSALPVDPAALYDSLDQYPYGCTEQITSRAMPLLYAGEIAALADRAGTERTAYVLQQAVSTILNRQNANGTIGLWRVGDHNASPWLGVYATDFLVRAKEAGYAVPDAAIRRALNALARIADGDMSGGGGYDYSVPNYRWHKDTYARLRDRARAYALYVLAREGQVDVSRLRYVHDEELDAIESPLARAHIAAALALVGDRARSSSAFEKAIDVLGYANGGDYYQTPRRDLAGVLALAVEANDADVVERMAQRVGEETPDPDRLTTQEKAFLLLAAHALLGGEDGPQIRVEGMAGVNRGARFVLDEAGVETGASFENRGTATVWRTVVARGAPSTAPPAAAEGVAVSKSVRHLDGSPADMGSVVQGDRLVVEITLTPRERRLLPMIVVDLLPAGFEIEATLRPEDGGSTGAYSWLGDIAQPQIAEARDDRYVAAINLTGEARTLAYVVRAVTPGRYTAPGAVAEDMYRPDVFARSAAFIVKIAERS